MSLKKEENILEKKGLMEEAHKIIRKKSKTGAYTNIFEVKLPVSFFFTKKGFDGIELDMRKASPEDLKLSSELCTKLAEAMHVERGKKS